MIDVKTAVQRASDFLKSVYPRTTDLRLEEVEIPDGVPPLWSVTLSFMDFPSRTYKRVILDAETGEVKSMRIRELA